RPMVHEGLLDGRHDVGKRRDMKHPVDAAEIGRNAPRIADVNFFDRQVRIRLNVSQVLQTAGAEIIEDGHTAPVREQPFDEMASDESGPPGDNDLWPPIRQTNTPSVQRSVGSRRLIYPCQPAAEIRK